MVMTVGDRVIDAKPEYVGTLRSSSEADGAEELGRRLAGDGYLYLPGFLDRARVLDARAALLGRLRQEGFVERMVGTEAVARPGAKGQLRSDLARECAELQGVLYGSRMLSLFEGLLGESVRHFDFTWLRAIPPGSGTRPHMDTVFMNRGSQRLLTAWTPFGDIPTAMGGVAVLEGSHRSRVLQDGYADRDVDTYCADDPGAGDQASQETMIWNGVLSDDPEDLRATIGSRWLTSSYRAGDVLVFTILTAHVGLDNQSGFVRLSSDSRYQPAADPVDGRWVGPDPSAHGARSKVGLIC